LRFCWYRHKCMDPFAAKAAAQDDKAHSKIKNNHSYDSAMLLFPPIQELRQRLRR
jgi:hypothetical protein